MAGLSDYDCFYSLKAIAEDDKGRVINICKRVKEAVRSQ